jgi:hypothetical protein
MTVEGFKEQALGRAGTTVKVVVVGADGHRRSLTVDRRPLTRD